jgi:hypothetical protein
MESAKDIDIALLGAAVGLAGLLLVVSGFVLAQANTFPPETTDDVFLRRYEIAAKFGLVPFVLALLEAGLCLLWLISGNGYLFWATVYTFFLLLILTAVYGSVLLLRYL